MQLIKAKTVAKINHFLKNLNHKYNDFYTYSKTNQLKKIVVLITT